MEMTQVIAIQEVVFMIVVYGDTCLRVFAN